MDFWNEAPATATKQYNPTFPTTVEPNPVLLTSETTLASQPLASSQRPPRKKKRTTPYPPEEHAQSKRHLNRTVYNIVSELQRLADVHPDSNFLLKLDIKGARNIELYSRGLDNLKQSKVVYY